MPQTTSEQIPQKDHAHQGTTVDINANEGWNTVQIKKSKHARPSSSATEPGTKLPITPSYGEE